MDALLSGFLRIGSKRMAMRVRERNCRREIDQELMQAAPGAAGTQTVTGGDSHPHLSQ